MRNGASTVRETGTSNLRFWRTTAATSSSNVERYEEWHAYFRRHQPPALVVWGKGDFIFAETGAEAYRKDLQTVELHMLDAGHFALETNAREIASYMHDFLLAYDAPH
jgi:pimeloyl-ACP methyl ester carboxylesterase